MCNLLVSLDDCLDSTKAPSLEDVTTVHMKDYSIPCRMKNEDVCKKLELKMLRFDRVMDFSVRPVFFLLNFQREFQSSSILSILNF